MSRANWFWKSAALISIGIACWLIFVAPGLRSLAPAEHYVRGAHDIIAFALEDRFSVAEAEASARVDSRDQAKVRVYFAVWLGEEELAVGDEPVDVARIGPSDTWSKGPKNGFSIVLAGPFANALESCNDDDVEVSSTTFDGLTDTESRSVVRYLRSVRATRPGEGADIAPDVASSLSYRRLYPTVLYSDDSFTFHGPGDARLDYAGYFTYFTCSFSRDALWSLSGSTSEFVFPGVALSFNPPADATTHASITRSVTAAESPSTQISYSAGDDASNTAEGATFYDRKPFVGIHSPPALVVPRLTLRYLSEASRQQQDRSVFLAGIGLTVIGALAMYLLRFAAAVVAATWAGVRMALARRLAPVDAQDVRTLDGGPQVPPGVEG